MILFYEMALVCQLIYSIPMNCQSLHQHSLQTATHFINKLYQHNKYHHILPEELIEELEQTIIKYINNPQPLFNQLIEKAFQKQANLVYCPDTTQSNEQKVQEKSGEVKDRDSDMDDDDDLVDKQGKQYIGRQVNALVVQGGGKDEKIQDSLPQKSQDSLEYELQMERIQKGKEIAFKKCNIHATGQYQESTLKYNTKNETNSMIVPFLIFKQSQSHEEILMVNLKCKLKQGGWQDILSRQQEKGQKSIHSKEE